MAYEKKYNDRVSIFGGSASDALRLFVDALKKVGEKHTSLEASRKAIRDHLENIKGFVGQHGVFNFSPQHHMGLTKDAYIMVVIKSGDFALAQ